MAFAPLGARRLLFVTGKGGVGKTTISAALARTFADAGKSVLLVALDERSEIAQAFGLDDLDFHVQRVDERLSVMALDTEAALREYLKINLRIPVVTKLGPLASALDFVASAAPGVREILTIGKLCYEVRERHYDLVIADAPATGHVVGYLSAPQSINAIVRVGLIRSQTDWMVDILQDPATTGVVAVTTPEEMPVLETRQLLRALDDETNVSVAAVVMNRMPDPVGSPADLALLERMLGDEASLLHADGLEGARTAVALAVGRRREAEQQFAILRDAVANRFPIITQANVVHRETPAQVVADVASDLAQELS